MRMKELRTEKGWSREELADRAGVTAAHIAELESENCVTTTHTMLKVAAALGRTVDEVFLY